jgi:hypothetical protein
MIKPQYTEDELKTATLTVNLCSHIVRDLKTMETVTKIPVDEIVTKALKMFIATHGDYLGKRKPY